MIDNKYFTAGYIYIYSIFLGLLDSFTLSRDNTKSWDFELLSSRVLVIFTYWLLVKNFAGVAERKGYSYKLAMIASLIGLPAFGVLFSVVLLKTT